MLQNFPIMPGSRCLLYDFKCLSNLKLYIMLLICTCPEYCWCYLKVKFDGSSEEFIISITSLVCSRFMCFQLATFWLSTQVDSSDDFYLSQPVSSMDKVCW